MPATTHAVFISHSTSDSDIGREVCEALEAASIGCWIAPRDILPGQTWSGAIVRGIGESDLVIVLLSAQADSSVEVLREVELASRGRKQLLAVRVEDVAPSGDLAYFLSATQWFDALRRPIQPSLERLVEVVREHLGAEPLVAAAQEPPESGFVEVDLDDFGRSGGRGRPGFIQRLLEDR